MALRRSPRWTTWSPAVSPWARHPPLTPDDGVGTRLVAAIRDGLRSSAHADAWGPAWVAEIRRYLTGMRLELQWRSGAKPSIDEYLSNHDSVGLRFAFATLLVVDDAAPDDWRPGPGTLSEAADATALAIRLANDLAGAARERAYGDVNVLTLGMASEQVGDRIRRETERCRQLYAAVPPVHQRRVSYLARVSGSNLGVLRRRRLLGPATPVPDYRATRPVVIRAELRPAVWDAAAPPAAVRRREGLARTLAEPERLLESLLAHPWGQVSASVYETGRLVSLAPGFRGTRARTSSCSRAQRATGAGAARTITGLVPALSATEALLSAYCGGGSSAGPAAGAAAGPPACRRRRAAGCPQ